MINIEKGSLKRLAISPQPSFPLHINVMSSQSEDHRMTLYRLAIGPSSEKVVHIIDRKSSTDDRDSKLKKHYSTSVHDERHLTPKVLQVKKRLIIYPNNKAVPQQCIYESMDQPLRRHLDQIRIMEDVSTKITIENSHGSSLPPVSSYEHHNAHERLRRQNNKLVSHMKSQLKKTQRQKLKPISESHLKREQQSQTRILIVPGLQLKTIQPLARKTEPLKRRKEDEPLSPTKLSIEQIKEQILSIIPKQSSESLLLSPSCDSEMHYKPKPTIKKPKINFLSRIEIGTGCFPELQVSKSLLAEEAPSNNTRQERLQSPQISEAEQHAGQIVSVEHKPKIPRKNTKAFVAPYETYFYRDLLWKVNYSNGFQMEIPIQYEHRIRAYVGKGNNSSMVRGLINRRIWISLTDKVEEASFVWTQIKALSFFSKQPPKNQELLPPSGEASYFQGGGILSARDRQVFDEYFRNNRNVEERSDERMIARLKWYKSLPVVPVKNMKEQKLHNHLINNYVVGNKKALFHTMSAYYTDKGEDVFDYLPLTFHVQGGTEDQVFYKFLKYYYKRAKEIKERDAHPKQYNAWIVKPGQNSNRGRGIQLCLTLEEIKTIVKKRERYPDGSYRTHIVQSYIERPMLFMRRKFDLRHYIMMTCINGFVKGYWYRDGYVRTTSTEYTLKASGGSIHLTNDAVQKNLPDYGKYEKGNKISYDELQAYMKTLKIAENDFYGCVYPRMKKIATDTMRACSATIDPSKLASNFQVFGLDFMIDAQCKVWLIEVNSNPCLQLSCPLLGTIIPRMVENALQLTMDAMYPPPVRFTPKGLHYAKNLEQQNRFELVYDQKIEGLYKPSVNTLDEKLLEEEDDVFEDDGQEWEDD